MTIIQQPDALSLSYNIRDFRISSTASVSFVLKKGDVSIVAQTYEPGQDGYVTIKVRDIIHAQLAFVLQTVGTMYEQPDIVADFTAVIDTTEITFRAIRSGVENFADTAANFLTANWLTWQPQEKPVTYASPEFLTYYAVLASSCKLKAYYTNEAGNVTAEETITVGALTEGKAYTIPMQYAAISTLLGGKLPALYDVWIEDGSGNRLTYIQRYYAGNMKSEQEDWILFENSLGGIDTFRAYGATNFTGEHTHNIAEIDEVSEEYRVDTQRKYQKNTGYLNMRECRWLLDFFPSARKLIYTAGALRAIVVTDSDVTYQDKELPSSYTFTYKYATAKPLLNIARASAPAEVLNIAIPDLGNFTVPPRLVELASLPLTEGALFPVQSPYDEAWKKTTAGALFNYISNKLTTNYNGGGGIGHTHNNLDLLQLLSYVDEYLEVDGKKIKAGYADDFPDEIEKVKTFLKGLTVNGDKASIDKDGNATVQQLIALVKAQVAALEVTGNTKTDSLDVTETAKAKDVEVSNSVTTLNAIIQALAKTHDLTVENTADIMNGIIRQYLSSESFVSGFLGSGFKIWKDEQGLWHGELDELTVRKTFLVFELVVQKIVHQGGMVIRSAAGGKLKKVTDGGTYWKCEHDSTDDFVVGDQVLCQTFTGTSMKRYWRLVTSAGVGYFNLSKSDCEASSANPEAGDEVAVLGNRTVTARQKAQIDCAVGDDAPYRDDYSGINSYSLVGKLINRTGNLSGITDPDFGALSGSGLYGINVYLKGIFRLLSGKTVETAISDAQAESNAYTDGKITKIETSFEIREGQISSKVTEATVAATNAGNSAVLAQGYASTAGQRASAAAGSATDAANILTVVTQKETSIQQTAQAIELKAVRAESAAGRAESAEASINLKADGIVLQASNQAAKSAVDELSNKTGTQLLPNDWTVGNGGTTFYHQNGDDVENQRIIGANHLGQNVILWSCKPSGNGGGDGGWNTSYVNIDNTKTYRFSVFVKKVGESGVFYLGVGYNTVCDLNTSTKNENPYFYQSDLSGWRLNGWLLITGYVYPYGVTGLSNINGEIWDCSTGQLLGTTTSFNWANDAVSTFHRCYLYYNNESTNRQYMYAPRIDLVDGNEPSIAQLLGMSAIQSYAASKANDAENNAKTYSNNTFTTKTEFSSQLTILNNSISSKVSQTDFNSLGSRVGNAETTISQHTNQIALKASQSDLTALGSRMTSAEAKITPDQINLTVQSQINNTAITYANLAAKLAGAKMLYTDPAFKTGRNSISVYNNNGNGTVSIDLVGRHSDNPTDSNYQIKIVASGFNQSPNRGGFYFENYAQPYAEYICKFIAWVPTNCSLNFDSNSIGNGGYQKWLTPTQGQGKWTEYVSYVRAGDGGNSSTNFYSLINTTDETVTWWLCYATVFDCSKNEYTPDIYALQSSFNMDASGISMVGKKIAFTGLMTFSSLAADAQNKINAAQSTADTANSTASSALASAGTANSGLTTLRNSLGSLAYDNAVSLAKLDTTIIEGGYIKTSLINANAIITNELLATKIAATDITTRRLKVGEGCTVGDFSIGSGRIGISASPENIGNSGMFLYADMIGFNSTNRQAIVGTYSVLGYPRLGQFIDTTSNYMPNVGLMFDINSTNNGGRNYAFTGRGHGVLNGFMCGYAFQELSFTSANQWQEISKLTNVVGVYGNYSNWAVVLPTFASVCNALNISYNTPFQVQITVFCTAAVGSGKFFGRSNSGISGISGNQYPALYNWNADIDDGGFAMGPGDSFQIVLWSSNSGTSSVPANPGSYRAYIVNKLS